MKGFLIFAVGRDNVKSEPRVEVRFIDAVNHDEAYQLADQLATETFPHAPGSLARKFWVYTVCIQIDITGNFGKAGKVEIGQKQVKGH